MDGPEAVKAGGSPMTTRNEWIAETYPNGRAKPFVTDDRMRIGERGPSLGGDAKVGMRVMYAHSRAGYAQDREHANQYLYPGSIYTISACEIGSSHTTVQVDGIPRVQFNSVLFTPWSAPAAETPKPAPDLGRLTEQADAWVKVWKRIVAAGLDVQDGDDRPSCLEVALAVVDLAASKPAHAPLPPGTTPLDAVVVRLWRHAKREGGAMLDGASDDLAAAIDRALSAQPGAASDWRGECKVDKKPYGWQAWHPSGHWLCNDGVWRDAQEDDYDLSCYGHPTASAARAALAAASDPRVPKVEAPAKCPCGRGCATDTGCLAFSEPSPAAPEATPPKCPKCGKSDEVRSDQRHAGNQHWVCMRTHGDFDGYRFKVEPPPPSLPPAPAACPDCGGTGKARDGIDLRGCPRGCTAPAAAEGHARVTHDDGWSLNARRLAHNEGPSLSMQHKNQMLHMAFTEDEAARIASVLSPGVRVSREDAEMFIALANFYRQTQGSIYLGQSLPHLIASLTAAIRQADAGEGAE